MSLIQLWPHSSPCRGERYIGMWQAGQRHGPGVVVTQAGVCYQGTFQADKTVVSRVCPGLPLSLHPSPTGGPEAELRLFRGMGKGSVFLCAGGSQNLGRKPALPPTSPGPGQSLLCLTLVSPSATQVKNTYHTLSELARIECLLVMMY